MGAHFEIFHHRHRAKDLAAFRYMCDAAMRALGRGLASRSILSKRMRPVFGWTVPDMALNRVVLPAPLGPTMRTNWPLPTANEISHSAVSPP